MIYKTFFRKHIDLSRLISVSDAYFIDRMGHGGWFVGFDMEFQLMDRPISYERELIDITEQEFDTDQHLHRVKTIRGDTTPCVSSLPPEEILACVNLQKQIDELIRDWKAIKNSE